MSSTIETPEVLEPTTNSLMSRVKSAAIVGGIFVMPTAAMVGASFLGFKTSVNQLEAAKLAFETAKLTAATV